MSSKMTLQARRELVDRIAGRYRESTWSEKGQILNGFVAATGYGRKHATAVLNHGMPARSAQPRAPHPELYDSAVRTALIKVWNAANCISSKRLVPFLPDFLATLERFGHWELDPPVRERLLSISPATVDRLLLLERHPWR